MTKKRLIALLVAALIVVAGAAAIFAPSFTGPALPPLPDGPQQLGRHELALPLLRRVQSGPEAEGQTTSGQTLVTVGPTDCPHHCNAGMDRSLCYCPHSDANVCPSGWPLERGDANSICTSPPDRVRVRPDGAEDAEITQTF